MTAQTMNPAAGDTAGGVRDASRGAARSEHTTGTRSDKLKLTVCLPPATDPITVEGREAQTLTLLMRVGPRGFTSGEASLLGWARRTSAYVRKLRLAGVPIHTTWEATDDARVGRYTLAGPVVVVGPGVSQ
ncbi:hypothetical protein [Brevundimonas sp. LM2]|uniref:winged helix domain-containing protein n=1 Tax=Brevundimonas sp. LM2 TaxID=1938605 RepID=UPI0012372ED1|nr:hypothetical protein [Brevundimonas sp. LM2]